MVVGSCISAHSLHRTARGLHPPNGEGIMCSWSNASCCKTSVSLAWTTCPRYDDVSTPEETILPIYLLQTGHRHATNTMRLLRPPFRAYHDNRRHCGRAAQRLADYDRRPGLRRPGVPRQREDRHASARSAGNRVGQVRPVLCLPLLHAHQGRSHDRSLSPADRRRCGHQRAGDRSQRGSHHRRGAPGGRLCNRLFRQVAHR